MFYLQVQAVQQIREPSLKKLMLSNLPEEQNMSNNDMTTHTQNFTLIPSFFLSLLVTLMIPSTNAFYREHYFLLTNSAYSIYFTLQDY